jgi:tetratricopeptide (TPR) repeat protein
MGRFSMCLLVMAGVACGGTGTTVVPPQRAKPAPAVPKLDAALERNRERARALVSEGDAVLKVNVETAIEKYEQALALEPGSLDGLWKLSRALEKKEAWAAVAATLARAVALAPRAEYLHGYGHALVQLGHAGDAAAYERGRGPLERCLKVDPKRADCAYLLGEIELAADHLQLAAERFTLAVRLEPQQARYYVVLAAVYQVFRQSQEAEMVLTVGLRQVQDSERTRRDVAAMAVAAARLAAARHDAPTARAWLDRAETLMEDAQPELIFELASAYAMAALDVVLPRDTEKAQRLLKLFVMRVCRGAAARKYQDQCWATESLMRRISDLDNAPPAAASKPSVLAVPVPLPPGMPMPELETQPLRVGDAYTVWGASYLFRTRNHARDVTQKSIAVTGYIVKTNFGEAPRCAVHRGGIADPENCRAEIPAFWLGDRPDAAEADCIKVMGFASNFAQLFDAIRQADSQTPDEPYSDSFWGQIVPNPLPAAGAKVTVRGKYGPSFAKASSGAESNLTMGILDYVEHDVLEPAPELATLPGVKRRKR